MLIRSDIVAALLGAFFAIGFLVILGGTENAGGPRHPWNIQIEAERRCVNAVRRDLAMPASFRFRRQGDSTVGPDGLLTSFQFTTTHIDGRHVRHFADCELSFDERRGTALVATIGETTKESLQFAW